MLYPGIQDAGAVDAEENTYPRVFRSIVDVGEAVHPGQGIVFSLAPDSIDDTGSAGGRGDFSGTQNIEGQGVVWLVAGPVGHGDTGFQAQFGGGFTAEAALFPECRDYFRKDVPGETELVEKETSWTFFLEIPHHPLGESSDGRVDLSGEFHRDIITGKHNLPYPVEQIRLVLLDPGQLGGREIAGGVEKVGEAFFASDMVESLFPIRNGPGIAPDDGRAQDFEVPVHAHQAVHLVGDADGRHFYLPAVEDFAGGGHEILPPGGGFLFRPSFLPGDYGRLILGIKRAGNAFAGPLVHEGSLYRGTSDIET